MFNYCFDTITESYATTLYMKLLLTTDLVAWSLFTVLRLPIVPQFVQVGNVDVP
jgi:hypothetical protein